MTNVDVEQSELAEATPPIGEGGSANRPMGRLDPTQYWNQPVGQPLYPKLPYYGRNGEHVQITYETDLGPVLDVLPYDLSPAHDPPRVIVTLGGFPFSSCGPFTECWPWIPVVYEGRPYNYVIVVYLGNDGIDEWFAAGREIWGHSKKQGEIYLERYSGRGIMRGWCERPRGKKLVDVTVGPFERLGEPADVELHPSISIRTIPRPDCGEPETVQLLETAFDAQIMRDPDGTPKLWLGQGSIEIARSEQDPWYKLPVRNVISASLFSSSWVTNYAKILKTYI